MIESRGEILGFFIYGLNCEKDFFEISNIISTFVHDNYKTIMRKLVLFLIILIPVTIVAQKRKYEKYIKKYDVLQYLPAEKAGNPSVFWRCVVNNNPALNKYIDKILEPKGLFKKAVNEVAAMNVKNEAADRIAPKLESEELDKDLHRAMLGDSCHGEKIKFCVLNIDEWNASSTPDGHIYINYGLMKRLNFKDYLLAGVLAHEIAHYMLRHILIHRYKYLKKERENNIGAAIGMTGTAIGNLAAASAGVSNGSSEEQKQQYQQIWDNAKKQTAAFYYKYGRDEEIEADIIAYRFLEWVGIDPQKYIETLNMINLDSLTGAGEEDSDHPSTEDRVGILSQLKPANFIIKETQEEIEKVEAPK